MIRCGTVTESGKTDLVSRSIILKSSVSKGETIDSTGHSIDLAHNLITLKLTMVFSYAYTTFWVSMILGLYLLGYLVENGHIS